MQRSFLSLFAFSVMSAHYVNAQDWKVYADSAKYFIDQKKTSLALSAYEKAKSMLPPDSATSEVNADLTLQIGIIHQNSGRFAVAEPILAEALALREKVSGRHNEVYIRTSTIYNYIFIQTGRYDEAEPLCRETLSFAEKVLGKNHFQYSRALRNLGMLSRGMGKFAEAEAYFLEAQAIVIHTHGKEKFEYASITNDLGATYVLAAQSEKALATLLEARTGYGRSVGTESSSYSIVCGNLGLVYKNLGEFALSEEAYVLGMQIRENLDGRFNPAYAQFCYNLGDLYLLTGRYEKAEELLLHAATVFRNLNPEHPEYARAASKLGLLHTLRENYNDAEAFLVTAKKIREKRLTKAHPEYAISVSMLGYLYLSMGKLDMAETFLKEAVEVSLNALGETHPERMAFNLHLANVYMKKNELEKALSLLGEIKKAWAGFGKANQGNKGMYNYTGRVYWVKQDLEKALENYSAAIDCQMEQIKKIFRFASESEKNDFLLRVADSNDEFNSFLSQHSSATGDMYDLTLAYRQLILSSFQSVRKSIIGKGDKRLTQQYNKWMDFRKDLAKLYTTGSEESEVRQVEDSANRIERFLVSNSEEFMRNIRDNSWMELRQRLAKAEAAIEFTSYQVFDGANWMDDIQYGALILRKDAGKPQFVKLFKESELDKLLKIYRGASPGEIQLNWLYVRGANRKGKELYDLIWKPLEEYLHEISTIYFSPSGTLYKVSFSALSQEDGKFLGDKYRLVQLNSTDILKTSADFRLTEKDQVTLFGGIQFDADSLSMVQNSARYRTSGVGTRALPDELPKDRIPGFSFLTGTVKEMAAIERLGSKMKFNVTSINGLLASEETFKDFENNAPAVVHLGTHGYFFPDPGKKKKRVQMTGITTFSEAENPLIRSGLALAGANNAWKGQTIPGVEDGILTSYEISNMYLPNTKLAVLSACETGLGDIQGSEGVFGLQRAFKMAGVENLVMSLWKVPDYETAEFMQLFYEKMFNKETIQDAFHNAQKAMRNKYRNDPFKWAAWVLVR